MNLTKRELLEDVSNIIVPAEPAEDEFTMHDLVNYLAERGTPTSRSQLVHRLLKMEEDGTLISRDTIVDGRRVKAYKYIGKEGG